MSTPEPVAGRYGEVPFVIDRYGRSPVERPAPTPPMPEHEVARMFAIIVAHDNRDTTDAAIATWTAEAHAGRWTFDEAVEAIRRHYREQPGGWLMPGHVTDLVRRTRRDRHDRAQAARDRIPVDTDGQRRVAAIVAGLDESLGARFVSVDDDARVSPTGRHVDCDSCSSLRGAQCQHPTRGNRVSSSYVHPSRMVRERAYIAARTEGNDHV